MEPGVVAVVLAAGASTRMGSPKALLDLGGRTALEILAASLRDGGAESVVVVTAADGDVAREARRVGANVVVHRDAALGRTSSLQAALAAVPRGRAILVAPVDCPLVLAETVRALVARAADAPIVRPRRGGRAGHPIVLGDALREEIAALAPDAPLRALVHRDATRRIDVDVDDEEIHANLDTPDDARRARARLEARR